MIAIIPVQTYKHFRSTVAGASVTLNEDAFAAALQSMILECAALVREKIPGHHRITFVCDDGPKSAIYSAVYANFKIKNANVAQIMGGLTHLDDKKHPPLQAADMMASIGRDEALSLIQNPPEIEWRVLKNGSKRRMPRIERIPSRLSPNIFQNIHFWDWPLLEKILEVQS